MIKKLLNKNFNIFYKLLLFFFTASIIPLIILSILFYFFISIQLKSTFINQILYNEREAVNYFEELINEYEHIIEMINTNDEIISILNNKEQITNLKIQNIYQTVYSLMKNKQDISALHLLSSKNNFRFSTKKFPDYYDINIYKDWGVFRKAKESGDHLFIYIHDRINSNIKPTSFTIGKAITNKEKENIGYIFFDIYEGAVYSILNNINKNFPMDITLTNDYLYPAVDIYNSAFKVLFENKNLKNRILNNKNNYFFSPISNNDYLVTFSNSTKYDIKIIGILPVDFINKIIWFFSIISFFVIIITLSACILFAFIVARHISRPIKQLAMEMQSVQEGNFSVKVHFDRNDEIGFLGNSFNKMVNKLNRLEHNIIEKQKSLKFAEISALQAQINPHFFYNTLNTIKSLAKLNCTEEIINIVVQIGNLFRSSLDFNTDIMTVKESIEFINDYLSIQKIRFEDRLNVVINISKDIYSYKIPKLLLQPVIENSIIHGLEKKVDKGTLILNGYKKNNTIIFEIIDNGIGMNRNKVNKLMKLQKKLEKNKIHIGLNNLINRLILYYEDKFILNIESKINYGTKVIIKIPEKIQSMGNDNV